MDYVDGPLFFVLTKYIPELLNSIVTMYAETVSFSDCVYPEEEDVLIRGINLANAAKNCLRSREPEVS